MMEGRPLDLFDVVKIAARRWFVVIPLVLITLYIAYGSYSSVKPVYYTSVSIGLVSPSVKEQQPIVSGEPTTVFTNGLADSGGIGLLSNLLALTLGDGTVRSQVQALGGTARYESSVFTLPSAAQLPIVVVSASGPSKEVVENTVSLASQQAGPVLEGVQASAGVPTGQMVTAFPLSNVPEAYGALPGRTREAGAVVVGGLLIALIAAVLVDTLIARVRPRKAAGAPFSPPSASEQYLESQSQSTGPRRNSESSNGRYDQPRSRT